MFDSFVSDIALQMGMQQPKVSLVEGKPLGCVDAYLLNISSQGHIVGAIVYPKDIEKLQNKGECDWLEVRIRSALSRLQMLLRP